MPYFFRLPAITDLTIGQQAALNEPIAFALSGGPGTGKSVVSLWRHIRNHEIGAVDSLLLTYTKTLQRYLSESARSINQAAAEKINRTYWWTTHNAETYDEIIVDEAQDVQSSKYDLLKHYSNSICYSADDQQILYPTRATTERQLEDLFPNNEKYLLDENFRNTYEIMHFVKSLFPNRLITQDMLNNLLEENRRGNKPILLVVDGIITSEIDVIMDIINEFRSETHNIAILVPLVRNVNYYFGELQNRGVECSQYVNNNNGLELIENVHITTFKSAKGTEFDTVIIPNFHNMENNITQLDVITDNDYYVALTRVRRNLYLLSSEDHIPFLERNVQQTETYSIETF